MKKEINIAIIGLGYVGLPLFCLLSKYFPCIGIDKDTVCVTQLKDGVDYRECENQHNIKMALQRSLLTSTYSNLTGYNVFFVCIPTGIDENKLPELKH